MTESSPQQNDTTAVDGPYSVQIQVRWSDFDRFGHVNNAAYLDYAQEARNIWAMEQVRVTGREYPTVVVRRVEADYLRPVMPTTSEVTVVTEVTRMGRTSFTTRQTVKDRDGAVAAVVDTVQVHIDVATARPAELNPDDRAALSRFTRAAIEGGASSESGEGRGGDITDAEVVGDDQ